MSSLEWLYLLTKYHENLPSGSKAISGGHTDRQTDTHTHTHTHTGDLINLLSFLDSRIRMTDFLSNILRRQTPVSNSSCFN
jgi:hypothetical protein